VGHSEWTAQSRCGGDGPHEGWICSSLGVRHPAPRLTLQTRATAPRTSLLTVLAGRAQASPRVSIVRDGGSTLVAVTDGSHTDWIAVAGITTGGPIDTDGLLAVCRVASIGEVDRGQVGGRHLRVDVDALGRLSRSLARGPLA
jgi:hypothetical protein